MSTVTTPRELRPRGRWYAVAAAVAVVGVAVGVVVFLTQLRSWTEQFPELGQHFRAGETVPVDLRVDETVVLYVSPSDPAVVSCAGDVAGVRFEVTEPSYTFTFFSGGRSWAATLEITSDVTGTGGLRCTGSGAVVLAVGEKPDNGRLLRNLALRIAISAVPVVIGLGAAAALFIGVARRRRAHRREATGSAQRSAQRSA